MPRSRPSIAATAVSLAALLAAASDASDAVAQSATPGSTVTLPALTVEAVAPGPAAPPAASSEAEARRRLEATGGGTAVVATRELAGRADVSIADSLATVPGVIAASFLGGNDQPKINIRGSGLSSNPTERGLQILQDGLPINRADGSYIVGLIDPRQAAFFEVFRGYTANRLGAGTLGGAINFVSPTGSTAPGVDLSVEGGSFGYVRTAIQGGLRQGDHDALVQYSYGQRDGFRTWNGSDRTNFSANAGAKLSDSLSTRVFVGYTDLDFEIAGPLSWQRMMADPTQAAPGPVIVGGKPTEPGPNALRDHPRRTTEQARIGSRTTATFGANVLDLALGYTDTDDTFRFPVGTGYRLTDGGDFTGSLRWAYRPDAAAPLPLFETTATYVVGSAERTWANNFRGNRTTTYGSNDLDADTLSLWSGVNLPLGAFTLSPAMSYVRATRDNTDTFDQAFRPTLNAVTGATGLVAATDTSFSRSYESWNPSLALTWAFAPKNLAFVAVSRTTEAPTFDDLLEATGGTPNTGPTGFSTPDLEAQHAVTAEIGWRGEHGRFAWDVTTYYSWLDDELIRSTNVSGATTTANADRTHHFGIELGGRVRLTDTLSARVTYTYQDFRFDDDPLYGDGRIAGAPRHVVDAALRWYARQNWWLEGEVQWVPDDLPVDNANTLFSEAFAVVNARTHLDLDPEWVAGTPLGAVWPTARWSGFFEVRNVFDETFASSTLTLGRASRADQAAFLPGDGRAFYVGTRARF
ncbi:TonB-dependent receptor [Rhodovulum sp. PH10]|uniref:TonB-dependent receptor family protein n=1 Tax=Rhodovulum sp. PH10 TaxID=1187851 RepID=UPI00027C2B0A|nr:TonB-dependent receptor [Rhodovulum sp. PH10]EJW12539.1 TonB-dependent receptor [Rhodovulum sp. PH10]